VLRCGWLSNWRRKLNSAAQGALLLRPDRLGGATYVPVEKRQTLA